MPDSEPFPGAVAVLKLKEKTPFVSLNLMESQEGLDWKGT